MILALAIAAAGPLEESLATWVKAECDAESVSVVYSGLAVELPEGAAFIWDGKPCRTSPSVRVTVVDGGVPGARYSIKPRLEIYVRHPVARASVEAGDLILTEMAVVPLADVRGEPLDGSLIARGQIEAGSPVTSTNARHAPDGREGDAVVLFVQRGALVIEAPGTLMADSLFGQEVRVVNEATRTVSTGVLVEPGRVQIQ